MFTSINISYNVTNDPDLLDYWKCHYLIIDDEFSETSGICEWAYVAHIGSQGGARIMSVIKEYSKRNLNVERNLVRLLLDLCRGKSWNMLDILDWCNDEINMGFSFEEFKSMWKKVDQNKIRRLAVFC